MTRKFSIGGFGRDRERLMKRFGRGFGESVVGRLGRRFVGAF